MMPQGVEHKMLTWLNSEVEIDVNQSMMPQGVEHTYALRSTDPSN